MTSDRTRRRPGRLDLRIALLMLVAACLLLPDLGSHVARRAQEMRVLLTARDMAQAGHWLDPHFKGEPRLRKPPLMYWLVAGLYHLGAPTDSASWSRLPSALAGIAFVTTLYVLGRRLVGRHRAFAAALVAAMSVIVLRQAKLAGSDMCLTLFSTTAVLAGALALRGASQGWWLLCFLAAGLGFLTKGPAAVVLPPAAWLAYAGWRRDQVRAPFRQPAFWAGIALCLLITLPWYVFIMTRQPSVADAQVEAELNALLVASKHTGPFYYYAYTILHALAPWSLLLPGAVWAAARAGGRRAAWAFPLAWLASSVAVLSGLSSKQFHYTLLLAAPASLLIGCALRSRAPGLRRWSGRVQRAIVGLLLTAGLALLAALAWRPGPLPMLPGALCLLAAGLGALSLTGRPDTARRLVAAAFSLAALLPALVRVGVGEGAHGTASRDIATVAARLVSAGTTVYCVGPLEATSAFYANQPCRFARSLTEAWRQASPGDLVLATWHQTTSPEPAGFPAPPLALMEDCCDRAAAFVKPWPPPGGAQITARPDRGRF